MQDHVTFAELGVPGPLVEVLSRRGIESPFEVQSFTIPDAMAGRDIAARAPTGSGKTLAFGLPVLASLGRAEPRRPRGLILAPTRELAEQIRRELEPLAAAVDRSVLAIYGGVGFGPQTRALREGVDLLVACPGRLQDLLSQGELTLDRVDRVVIDEADRMADMGFLPVVQELLDLTSTKRQTLLFSATLDNDIQALTKQYQRDPARHEVGETEPDLSLVEHRFIATEKDTKLGLAADLIDDHGSTMVFCRTRHGVDRVARQLKRAGVKAGWIHGGRSQAQRNAALNAFTTGRVAVLVATDVAARGIHVDGVACVIHYDPPADHKDYVHRSGRTARAGSGGLVVSLVNRDQRTAVTRLRKKVGLPAGELEAAPPLRPRELETWVDQRPDRDRKRPDRNRRSRPRDGDGDRTSDKPKGRSNGDRAERSGKTEQSERAERTERRPRTGPGSERRRKPKGRSGSNGTRSRSRSEQGAAEPGAPSRPPSKAKTKTGAKAGRRSKARAKAKTATKSKRSGRPRTKDHKQRRRR
jgi:superfamily II DNA/RNA helicase